jgi:hypothetical protein
MPERKRKRRESFGAIRKLPSGRYQASYIGPDARRHTAPSTFSAMVDARAWLFERQNEISRKQWRAAPLEVTFGEYAVEYVRTRVT